MKKIISILIMILLTTTIFSVTTTFGKEILRNEPISSRDWTIVETFPIPESSSGLAYDGTYLYSGIYGSNGDQIYQIDPTTGSYSLQCTGPQGDAFGLTYDGTYLWTTDHPSNPAVALQFDMNGSLISQFNLPDQYMSGIAYDNGDFWVATYYNPDGEIYKVNNTGGILQQFPSPDNQPWDLCLGNNNLWMADYWGDAIYEIDPSDGSLLNTYASEGTDPAGIVWDGNYLWYCDNGQGGVDFLYKVDLGGSGTPEINVPVTSHDYGIVTVETQETWNAVVQSIGTGDLNVTGITFSGTGASYLSCSLSFPITITPGNQTQLPIVYEPLNPGELDAIATIESNDPVNPEVEITLSGFAVTSGPDIFLPEEYYCFGTVRINSLNRWEMRIQNMGDTLLSINNISSTDNHFTIEPGISYPIDLSPLSLEEIDIWFQPTDDTFYPTNILIYSNDPDENPFTVNVQGYGQDIPYPIGTILWDYTIYDPYDSSPKAIISLPDINGDNISEVVVCSEDDYIHCFNGNDHGIGDILWSHEVYAGSVYRQDGLRITEDIDDDGYLDIVIGTAWGDKSIITISGKTGEQIWKHDTHEYGDGGWVYMIDCSYDYNDDGVVDVLAATGDDSNDIGPKRVYCLDAFTGNSIWECPLGGPVFSVIGVEDFTGDGIPDAIAGASNDAETQGYAYGINGATHSVVWTFPTPGTSVWALAQIDDANDDDVKDVIIGDFYSSGNIYGIDATNGNQIYHKSIGSLLILRFINISDVNGDGHHDILPAHTGNNAIAIDGQNGNYIWSHQLVDQSQCVAVATDISGDEINDVFIGTLYNNNECYFLNGVNGTELHSVYVESPVDAIAAIPDIVGDGSMELVAGLRDGQVLCLSGGTEAYQGSQDIKITSLSENWNFISTPFNNSIEKLDIIVNHDGSNITWSDAVSAGYISDFIFGWDRLGQYYDFENTLDPGYGYWIYAYDPCDIWAENITIRDDNHVTYLKNDWNIIGIPDMNNIDKINLIIRYNSIDYSWNVAVINRYVNDYIFGWDRIGQSYSFANNLESGYAFWLYSYQPCTLKK